MNNFLLRIKIQERLNKLGSNDYDNIECWQIAEAFNKAQLEWCRRQLHGQNIFKEGAEQSTTRVDDLQILITSFELKGTNKKEFFEAPLPANYLRYNRVSMKGKSDCCPPRSFVVYPVEDASVDSYLRNDDTKPSFDWAETFSTISGDSIKIYRDDEFIIDSAKLSYYRFPLPVQFKDCMDIDTGGIFNKDQHCEFKDDIAELIIDDTCAILAGDIESFNQMSRNIQNSEKNN